MSVAKSTADKLLSLNPWARPVWDDCLAISAAGRSKLAAAQLEPSARLRIQQVRRHAIDRRLEQGARVWNAWALAMLEVLAGGELAKEDAPLWFALARVDVSNDDVQGTLDIAGCVFPGPVSWASTAIAQDVWAQGAQFFGAVDFTGAKVAGELSFENASLAQGLMLDAATVGGPTSARGAKWGGPLTLCGAKFSGPAWFRGGKFPSRVDATDAQFGADAGFGAAWFQDQATFAGARFGGVAGFENCRFCGDADFSNTRFLKSAWFENAAFEGAANFDVARFTGAIRFDGVSVADNRPAVLAQIERIRRSFAS